MTPKCPKPSRSTEHLNKEKDPGSGSYLDGQILIDQDGQRCFVLAVIKNGKSDLEFRSTEAAIGRIGEKSSHVGWRRAFSSAQAVMVACDVMRREIRSALDVISSFRGDSKGMEIKMRAI